MSRIRYTMKSIFAETEEKRLMITVGTPNFVILFAIMFPSTKYKSDIYE